MTQEQLSQLIREELQQVLVAEGLGDWFAKKAKGAYNTAARVGRSGANWVYDKTASKDTPSIVKGPDDKVSKMVTDHDYKQKTQQYKDISDAGFGIANILSMGGAGAAIGAGKALAGQGLKQGLKQGVRRLAQQGVKQTAKNVGKVAAKNVGKNTHFIAADAAKTHAAGGGAGDTAGATGTSTALGAGGTAGNFAGAVKDLYSKFKQKENLDRDQMHITRKRLSEIIREELQETAARRLAAQNIAAAGGRAPNTGAKEKVALPLGGEELEEMIREELVDALSK